MSYRQLRVFTQNMVFFDNSVCCETNDKMVRAVEVVDGEKDPLKHTTMIDINFFHSAGKHSCCRLCNKKHQIMVHEAQVASRVLTVASITEGRES